MFCSNCGNRIPDGSRFCSACGARLTVTVETPAVKPVELSKMSERNQDFSFDWSSVKDEPQRKPAREVVSPWGSSANNNEAVGDGAPRSRTMSFIDILKKEREEKARAAEAETVAELEVEQPVSRPAAPAEMPSFYVPPMYDDLNSHNATPFENMPNDEPTHEESVYEAPRYETVDEFDPAMEELNISVESEEPTIVLDGSEFVNDDENSSRARLDAELAAILNVGSGKPAGEEDDSVDLFEDTEEIDFPVKTMEPEEPVLKFEPEEDDEPEEAFDYEALIAELNDIAGTDPMEVHLSDYIDESEPYEPYTEEPEAEDEYIPTHSAPIKESEIEDSIVQEKDAEIEALKRRLAELMGEIPVVEPADEVEETPEVAEEPTIEEEPEVVEEPVVEEVPEVTEEPTIEDEPEVVEEPAVEEVLEVVEEPVVEEEPEVTEEPTIEDEPQFVEEPETEEVVEEPVVEEEPEVTEEPTIEDEPQFVEEPETEESVEEPVEEAEAVEAEPEKPVKDGPIVEHFNWFTNEVAAEPEVEAEPEAEVELPLIDPTPEVEEVLPLINEEHEEAVIAEAKGEAAEDESTDAMSVEELEKDLFGEVPADDAEAEATKKIDKFYTLYKKNEEFQRLLDEEYSKLKREDEEVVPTVSAILEEVENAAAEEVSEVAEVVQEAVAAAPAVEKAEKVVEETISAVETVTKEDAVADEETSGKGGTALTVIAVMVAVLLVILLAVILVLNFAPDSAIALKLDSIIEMITSYFSAVEVPGNFLL